jgi:transcriptional regulator with XRE-family HTH domain
VSSRGNRTEAMSKEIKRLVTALKAKREASGSSLRTLSTQIGVSFSTLARIERGEGDPDNNSRIRILNWLGPDAATFGLGFEKVAFVHFRANKNVSSKTIKLLLETAAHIKTTMSQKATLLHTLVGVDTREIEANDDEDFESAKVAPRSKADLEELAQELRGQVGLTDQQPFDALKLKLENVEVFAPSSVESLSREAVTHLTSVATSEWSAMSVPLDNSDESWAILRNDRHSLVRQRVTYLEECWHIMLGHKLTKIAKVSDSYGRTYDADAEAEAYYLAAATLLPEVAIKVSVKGGMRALEIAERFGVSPALVEFRIKRLGLWAAYSGRTIAFR